MAGPTAVGQADAIDVLELDRLSVGYDRAPVVRDLTLTVGPGEVVALLGANSAGKTSHPAGDIRTPETGQRRGPAVGRQAAEVRPGQFHPAAHSPRSRRRRPPAWSCPRRSGRSGRPARPRGPRSTPRAARARRRTLRTGPSTRSTAGRRSRSARSARCALRRARGPRRSLEATAAAPASGARTTVGLCSAPVDVPGHALRVPEQGEDQQERRRPAGTSSRSARTTCPGRTGSAPGRRSGPRNTAPEMSVMPPA